MKTIEEVGQIISELTDKLSIAIPTNAGDFNLQKLRETDELRAYWRGYLDCLVEMQKEGN